MSLPAIPALRSPSEFREVDEYVVPLSGFLAVRIYSDTKPHNLYLADLQKGLILVYKSVERIGEGAGFGLPVLQYSDGLYFSRSSKVYLSESGGLSIIRKEFVMDVVQGKSVRSIGLENTIVRATLEHVEELYRKHRRLRVLTLKRISGVMGLRTNFMETEPMGKVIVTYEIGQDAIKVKADLSHIKRKELKKVFMLNEQGSLNFTRYTDSFGMELVGRKIGAWENIDAEDASITDLHGRIGFHLHRLRGSTMRRGREYLKGRLDWIGLDYEIDPGSHAFEYGIDILGR